jgi:transcription initiation factor TFIIIB Brf1 subunit/transcription initiation factor TFIIB
LQTVADIADSCRRCRQLQTLQTVADVAGVADVAEKVATQALKSAVAENVKTVTGTNFNSNPSELQNFGPVADTNFILERYNTKQSPHKC